MDNEGGLNLTVIIVAAIIAIGALGGIYLFTSSGSHSKATSQSTTVSQTTTIYGNQTTTIYGNQTTTIFQNSSYQQSPNMPSCGSNYTLFNSPLFDPNSIISVLPLADFVPPDHVFPTPHAYIYTTNPTTHVSKDGAYFYAPANMVITQFAIRHATSPSGVNQTDYTLVFSPCREFDLYFHNVASLLYPPLLNASLGLRKQCGNQAYCSMSTDIPIGIGQPIGTIGNSTAGIYGVDIGARDYRLVNGRSAFVDPKRLCPLNNGEPNVFDRCYTVCPYSYFTQNLQKQIHFSSADKSVNGTSCGTVYQDVNGTAEGYWFPANNSTSSISPEATDIFLGHDNLQPSLNIFSIGVSVSGLQANRYSFQPESSGSINRDFSNVTPSNVFCYEANNLSGSGYSAYGSPALIYLQLVNRTTLLIQKQNGASCGNGPWSFGPNPANFVR